MMCLLHLHSKHKTMTKELFLTVFVHLYAGFFKAYTLQEDEDK